MIVPQLMSAIGTKRTSLVALHMSAFGGKADIALSVALTFGGLSFKKSPGRTGASDAGEKASRHDLLITE